MEICFKGIVEVKTTVNGPQKLIPRRRKSGSCDLEAVARLQRTFSLKLQHGKKSCVQMSVEMVELSVKTTEPVRSAGFLQQNRVFLDFFWDLAKPDQEVRLKAVEDLIQYLKTNNKVRQSPDSGSV